MSQFIKPNALARNGIYIICAVIILLGFFFWLIKYPDTVQASAILTGNNAPKPIVSYQTGRITHLFYGTGDTVKKGQIIGCLETTADLEEVLRLSGNIDSLYYALGLNDNTMALQLMSCTFSHLGELQGDYQSFSQAYIPFRDYVAGDYVNRKKALIHNDITYISRSRAAIKQQSNLYEEDLQLSQINLENNKQLLKDTVISEQEYRNLSSQNINKRLSVPQIQSSYVSSDAQLNDKRKELLDLEKEIRQSQTGFREAAYKFKSSIDEWKRTHLLTAVVSGKLAYAAFIQENQFVQAGKILAYVAPQDGKYHLEALIPQDNFGKVEVGQKVLLRFSAWQWQEYGTVDGRVSYISEIATDSGYVAKIELSKGFLTNRGKLLSPKEGLMAHAEIITKDMRLSERLYSDFIKEFKKD